MPISIDEFDNHEPADETNAERVVRFLSRNADKAYKAVEIAETTRINHNSIPSVLNRLHDRDLVRHREPYWAIGDAETVRNAAMISDTASFLDDELGAERRSEWVEAADGVGRDE